MKVTIEFDDCDNAYVRGFRSVSLDCLYLMDVLLKVNEINGWSRNEFVFYLEGIMGSPLCVDVIAEAMAYDEETDCMQEKIDFLVALTERCKEQLRERHANT